MAGNIAGAGSSLAPAGHSDSARHVRSTGVIRSFAGPADCCRQNTTEVPARMQTLPEWLTSMTQGFGRVTSSTLARTTPMELFDPPVLSAASTFETSTPEPPLPALGAAS